MVEHNISWFRLQYDLVFRLEIYFLLFLVFCIGCGIGMVDVGGQSIILKKFKRDSTQLIQLFHFVFNCGAILGNTIVGAYIEPAAETPCKGKWYKFTSFLYS